jgi:CBS domain-containing protein
MAKMLVPKRKVVILHETATALEAARAMCSNEIGCVLICDQKGVLSGILTDRDLTCAVVARNLGPDTTVDKVMTRGVWIVDDAAGIEDVVHSMKEHGVRRVAVVKEEKLGVQKCIGLVSLDDLISSRMIRIEDAADIVRSQILHKQHFIQSLRESEIEADAQLKAFIERMEERSGLTRSTTLSMLTIIMSSMVRSVHYSLAEGFLIPLPEKLRSRLEDLPAGPDQNISADFLVGEVVARFNLDPEQAIEVIRQFWDGMLTCCGQAEMERFAEELPEDLRNLIAPVSLEASQTEQQESQNPMQMH